MLVLMPMTADLFHYGHHEAIAKGSRYGEVVVGLLNDEDIFKSKGKWPVLTLAERRRSVLCCPLVKAVIEIPVVITEEFHRLHRLELIVHGDDFSPEKVAYHYPYAFRQGLYRSIPYEATISTTEIIRRINQRQLK
jgi:cytidyltransferase-like protein